MCTDVANAVLPSRLDYSARRSQFLKGAVAVGIGEVVNGLLGLVLPAGSASAAAFATYVADAANSRVAISILAYYWNTYQCGSKLVSAGPIYRGANWASGGISWACHTETWEISFNGGQTYDPINVTVCDIKYE